VIENAIKNEDLDTLSKAGFAINSKKSFVDQLTSKIKEGIDIVENIKLDQTSELEIRVRKIFDNLARRGFFKNPQKAFPIWKDLIVYAVTNPNGQIPYWSNLALWQVGLVDKSLNLYQYAKEVARQYTEAGTPMTADNVLNIIYADNFERIWEMRRQGALPIQFPNADVRYLFDPTSENSKLIGDITRDCIRRVYAGYKLLKTDPPEPIKILYSRLTGEPIEDTYQNNAEPTEDTYEEDQYEEDQEP
jgi:hypothetical protein